jgi:Tfp pilus assembly protein PilZ
VICKIITNLLKYTSQFKVSSFIKKWFEIFDLKCEIPYILFNGKIKKRFYNMNFTAKSYTRNHSKRPAAKYGGRKSQPDPRKHPRRSCLKSVFFNCGDQTYAGFIKNISRGGVFIETTDKFFFGQSIELVIPKTRIDGGKPIPGWIVHLSGTGIGVTFKRIFERRSGRERRNEIDRRSGSDRRKKKVQLNPIMNYHT